MNAVHIDPDRCAGHGRCYFIAPELFEPDELGDGQVVNDGLVPPALDAKARLAVANCPEGAISMSPAEAREPDGPA